MRCVKKSHENIAGCGIYCVTIFQESSWKKHNLGTDVLFNNKLTLVVDKLNACSTALDN